MINHKLEPIKSLSESEINSFTEPETSDCPVNASVAVYVRISIAVRVFYIHIIIIIRIIYQSACMQKLVGLCNFISRRAG